MPAFSTEVSHTLGQTEAQRRLASFLDTIREKYEDRISEVTGNWQEHILDFALTTYGIKVSGKIAVEDQLVRMDGELPFAALMFKGKIVSGFQEALQKVLR